MRENMQYFKIFLTSWLFVRNTVRLLLSWKSKWKILDYISPEISYWFKNFMIPHDSIVSETLDFHFHLKMLIWFIFTKNLYRGQFSLHHFPTLMEDCRVWWFQLYFSLILFYCILYTLTRIFLRKCYIYKGVTFLYFFLY